MCFCVCVVVWQWILKWLPHAVLRSGTKREALDEFEKSLCNFHLRLIFSILRQQLLPNRRRWKNAQADKRILPHIWRCKWCEMCEYWADFYLVCILFTPHLRESLQFPPEKTLARAGVPSGTTDGPLLTIISSHTMLQEHKEPAGRGISSLLLSDQLKETHKPLRKSSLFYQSLLVASWELKDKGYCVPAADMHCISWLVIHPAVLLPGKLMLLPFGVFCPQCSGCHMYGLFHGLPVYQMEQLFSCTPILYICFSSSNQSLTHFIHSGTVSWNVFMPLEFR